MARMSPCPPEPELRGFFLGDLPESQAGPLEEHLLECPKCIETLATLQADDALRAALAGQGTVDPFVDPDVNLENLIGRLKELYPPGLDSTVGAPCRASALPREPEHGRAPGTALPWDVRPVQAVPQVVIPGYEVLDELGRGGQSVVYKARHIALNRLVALKMILASDYAGSKERARFRVEAEAVARLQHPNIVQIHDIGEHDGRPYLALEYMPGGSLAQRIARQPLTAREAAELVEILARAVHYAHQQHIIHRDLKPANILVASEQWTVDGKELATSPSTVHCSPSTVKIADFGLAKRLDAAAALTSTDQIMGTPSYMAPEQAASRAKAIGPSTDIYALGAILYELLAGRPPFRAETPLETLQQILAEEPVSLTRLQPKVPRDLETICSKCLQKEPHNRYASANALAADLRRYLDGQPIRARPVGTPERLWRWCRRNPALATVGGLAAIALLGLVVFAISFAFQQARAAREIRQAQNETLKTLSVRSRDLGLTLCEQGEVASGLLWLARALQVNPEERGDAAHAVRRNLAAWRPRLRTLRAILPNPDVGGNDRLVVQLAYSPDGATIAGSEKPGIVLAWDAATGRLRGEPMWHGAHVYAMAFHPDGSLVTGCEDGGIRFWDVTTGALVREPFFTQRGPVEHVAVSADGGTLWTSQNRGRQVNTWEIGPARSLSWTRKVSPTGSVPVQLLSHDGQFFVAGNHNATGVQVYTTATGQPVGEPIQSPWPIRRVVASPRADRLVIASQMGGVAVWDVATGKRRFDLPHPGPVNLVVFSPNGRMMLTTGEDSTVRFWDARTGRPVGKPIQMIRALWAVAFSPKDGVTFVTAGRNRESILLWDTDLRGDGILATDHLITTARFSQDGRTLLTGGGRVNLLELLWSRRWYQGVGQFWDANTQTRKGKPLIHSQPILSATFRPDGSQCLVGSAHWEDRSGEASVWDTATSQKISSLPHGKNVGVVAVAFGPGDPTYLTGGRDNQAHLWDGVTGKGLRTFSHQSTVRAVAYRPPDGRAILTGSDDCSAQLWDADTGEKLGDPLPHPASVTSVAFSRDGSYLLTGCQDNKARLWDAETRQVIRSFAHRGWVLAVAFSPDGSLVLTGSADGTARLWDRATGLPVGPPVQHEKASLPGLELNWVPAVDFSPDGRTLVSGGLDAKARFRTVPAPVEGTPDHSCCGSRSSPE